MRPNRLAAKIVVADDKGGAKSARRRFGQRPPVGRSRLLRGKGGVASMASGGSAIAKVLLGAGPSTPFIIAHLRPA